MPQKPTTDTQPESWQIEIIKDNLKMQKSLLTYAKWIFGSAFVATLPTFIAAVFLGGWSSQTGFVISDEVLMFLGGATIVEAASFLGTVAFGIFRGPPSGK